MDKERTVQINEEKGRALRLIDDTGVSCTYALLTSVRTIYLIANSLGVSEGFGRRGSSEEPPQQPITRRSVRGFGTLCDESVSVIGDPDNKTKRVALSIRVRTAEEHAEGVKQWQRDGAKDHDMGAPSCCDAFLGFTTADWEIGNKDKWWLELYVAERTLESLADAILNKQARSLHIRVRLRNIYTDAGLGELDFGEPVNLFLRPSVSEGNVRRPEIAYGYLETWSLRFSGTVELSDPFKSESAPTPEINSQEEPRGPSDAERTLAALERLTAGVGSLRTTVVRLGWVLAVVLIVSVFIR